KQALEVLARPAILRVELQALAQEALALGRPGFPAVLQLELGDRKVKARRQRRIGRRLGLLQIALRDRLPVALDQAHLGLRFQRGSVIRHRLQRLADALLPLAVAQQLIAEDAALLVQQVGALWRLDGPRQLEIDELDAKLEVTSLAVKPSRVGESMCERPAIDPTSVAGVERRESAERLLVIGVELKGFEGA